MSKKFHRAFGVYAIAFKDNKLLVIDKNAGPYINRYDLPGGSLEDGESLNKAIVREVKEETGIFIEHFHQIGITSFKYPWKYKNWNYNQHICVFYEVNDYRGSSQKKVEQFVGQDSNGSHWIPIEQISIKNSSPLVLKAKDYLIEGRKFDEIDKTLKEWMVLQ